MGETACYAIYVYWISYRYRLLLNNEYRISENGKWKMEKFDIGAPLERILNYLLMELNFITI